MLGRPAVPASNFGVYRQRDFVHHCLNSLYSANLNFVLFMQLTLHLPPDSLPIELGGNLKVDHGAWLRDCFRSMNNRVGDLCDISTGPEPLFPPSLTGACQADEAQDSEDEIEEHVSEAAPSEDEEDVEELEEPVAIQVECVAHCLVINTLHYHIRRIT